MGAAAYKYWTTQTDGMWFGSPLPGKLLMCVFPGNVIEIDQVKYRPVRGSGYWGRVVTVPYTDVPPDFSTVPPTKWSRQADENSMGQVLWGSDDTGYDVRFPIVSNDPLWIDMANVGPVAQPPPVVTTDPIVKVIVHGPHGDNTINATPDEPIASVNIVRSSGKTTTTI